MTTMTYDPTADSSPKTDAYRPTDDDPSGFEGLILDYTPLRESSTLSTCQCGCRLEVMKGRAFRQGHDAKLKGKLIRAALANVEVTVLEGGMANSGSAETFLAERGWLDFLASSIEKRDRKAAARLKKEMGLRKGTDVRVTVRNIERDGKVVAIDGDHADVEYTLKNGTVKVGKFDIREIEVNR